MLWCAFKSEIISDGIEMRSREFVLHIQCSWRIFSLNKIVIASNDVYYPHSKIEDDEEYDWSKIGQSRFDELAFVFNEALDNNYIVKKIESDELGGVKILFDNNYVLEIFPNDSFNDSEHWRFIDEQANKHLVVSGEGLDYD